MSFLRGVFISYSNQIIIYVFALVSSVLTARGLGPDGRGFLAASMALFSAVSLIVDLGVSQGLTFAGSKSKETAAKASFAALNFSVLNGLLGVIVITVLYITNSSLTNNIPSTVIFLIAAGIPFSLLMNYAGGILLSQNFIVAMNSITFLTESIRLIGLITLFSLGKMSVLNVITLWFINIILTSLVAFTLVLKNVGINKAISKELVKEVLTIGYRSFLVGIMASLLLRSDILILNVYRTPAEIGYYSIAATFVDKLILLPKITGRLLFPLSVRDQDELIPFLMKVSRFTAAFLFLMLVLIAPVLPFAINILYGKDFAPSTAACYILLPGIFFLGLLSVLSQHFSAKGYPPVSLYAPLIALVVNVGLNLIFIPKYGYYAAAATSSISYAIYYLIFYFKFNRQSGHRLRELVILTKNDLSDIRQRIIKIKQKKLGKGLVYQAPEDDV